MFTASHLFYLSLQTPSLCKPSITKPNSGCTRKTLIQSSGHLLLSCLCLEGSNHPFFNPHIISILWTRKKRELRSFMRENTWPEHIWNFCHGLQWLTSILHPEDKGQTLPGNLSHTIRISLDRRRDLTMLKKSKDIRTQQKSLALEFRTLINFPELVFSRQKAWTHAAWFENPIWQTEEENRGNSKNGFQFNDNGKKQNIAHLPTARQIQATASTATH